MNPGDPVRFKSHGETGEVMTVSAVSGGEVELKTERGRKLTNVPVELLVCVDPKAWREVDELEAG